MKLIYGGGDLSLDLAERTQIQNSAERTQSSLATNALSLHRTFEIARCILNSRLKGRLAAK